MSGFALYIMFGYPVFLGLFIHLTRKVQDVELGDFIIMMIIAALPIAREVTTLMLIAAQKNSVVFKKYGA